MTFGVLGAVASLAQLFVVRTGRNQLFHTALVFIIAAALLLPPELVALVAVVMHVPDWVKERYRWYVQSFNICNYTLDALAAWGAAHVVLSSGIASGRIREVVAGAAASTVFVFLNHFLLAVMLRLARGHSFRESRLFAPDPLATDLVLAGLGVALASLWRANPLLVPALVASLALVYRSLSVAALLRESEDRFRAMFEFAGVGIDLTDLDGRVIASNRALQELLGYSESELRGKRFGEFTHPEDAPLDLELLEEMHRGKRDHYRLEKRYVAKDGKVIWANLAVSLVRNVDRHPKFVITMAEDVTERKRAEQALQEAVVMLERSERDLRVSREETIRRLSYAAEFRDEETGRHIERMSHYCALLGRKLRLDPDRCELLRIASPLHDIGKIAIPDRILLKPGKLNHEEYAIMKQHAEIGYRLLSGSDEELLELAALLARTHHERVDGTGYPRGLTGDAIPIEGRIAAVADVFDALTSDRVYRPALSVEEAIEFMRGERGAHFDAEIFDLFLASLDEILSIRVRYSDTRGQTAIDWVPPLLEEVPAVVRQSQR